MSDDVQGSPVIPGLRYRDAAAAMDWLVSVLGFEPTLVVPDDAGGIAHAQLRLGHGMVMIGSIRDDEFGKSLVRPDEIDHKVTQSAYIVVPDADAVYARALEAGAEILMPIEDQGYGGRGFSCRDPEGHVWSAGSYDPWA